MNPIRFACTFVVAMFLLSAAPAMAQMKRVSPHETISGVVDGNRVTIIYGRPRKIWGSLVPYGKVWRTGADEATLLITQQEIKIGDADVPAGAYTLWTQPNEDGTAKLIINKQIGQWGQDYKDMKKVYDEANDLARVDLKKEPLDKTADQFTMSVGKDATAGGGVIKLMWEDTQYSVPFTVVKK
jgi:Protein of unknown function (DUF2911)